MPMTSATTLILPMIERSMIQKSSKSRKAAAPVADEEADQTGDED